MTDMVVRVEVPTELISWALERSGFSVDDLAHRFPKLEDWEAGEAAPTLKQLENFASATHTPLGFFFLSEPPDEPLPLPDFRTMGDQEIQRPSADLLDTLFNIQQRQDWYRDYVLATGEQPLSFVGSLDTSYDVVEIAKDLRDLLGFQVGERGSDWGEAFRRLVDGAEDLGILVMVNGVVGNNTHRKLNPREFRGFALSDEYAPAVFVNGADTKPAQIFTLAHELAHIWLGESALSDVDLGRTPENAKELWCNQVAAELLVPMRAFRRIYNASAMLTDELERLARWFKVSTLVILRRIKDAGYVDLSTFVTQYQIELARIMRILSEQDKGSGGNFYNTQSVRTGRRFTRALVSSALEGQTLYRDAFQLLGVKKLSTFQELASRLGVA